MSSDGSLTPRASDSQEAADWLESNSLDAQLAKEQEHKAAVWAAAAATRVCSRTCPRSADAKARMSGKEEAGRRKLEGGSWKEEVGSWKVVEVLEAKWIGDDEDEQQQRVCVPTAPLPSPSIA